MEATFSLSRSIAGTAGYMAPEQVGGEQNLTIAVDVHALGAILYELLAGEPPFAREEWLLTLQRVRDETPPPLRGGRNGVAVDL